MTRSMSMVALASLTPVAMASNPPWASSRSPGTTALTQVGVRQQMGKVGGGGGAAMCLCLEGVTCTLWLIGDRELSLGQ